MVAQITIPGHYLQGKRFLVKRQKGNRALLVIPCYRGKSKWFTIDREIVIF
jgi:hypothetical protein